MTAPLQHEYQRLDEGEVEEIVTSCPGLLQQFSPSRQAHNTTLEEVRFCGTDKTRLQVHPGRISDLSAVHGVHMLSCSLVLLQITSRRAAGLIGCSFLSRCSCSPSESGAHIQFRLFQSVPASSGISS